MQNPNGFRVVLLLAPALFILLPLACLIVILERISQILFSRNLNRDFRTGVREFPIYDTNDTSTGGVISSTDVIVTVNLGPTLAYLGISVITGLLSILVACGIWELRRVEGSMTTQRVWSWINVMSGAIMAGLSIAVVTWTSILQGREGWKGRADLSNKYQQYTRETWACQIDAYFPQQDWAGPVCGLVKATRFMLIPLALFSLLVIYCTWVLIRERGGIKWLMGGKGRYAGFDSAYEMNPTGPAPPYQPTPQYYPNPQMYPGPQQYPGPQVYGMPQQYPAQPQAVPVTSKEGTGAEERPVFR